MVMADEKQASGTSEESSFCTDQTATDSHSHKHGHLHRLFHPSGRIFHIVPSPHEIERKRKELLSLKPNSESSFDILVHGTPEHISAVREIHNHQSARRDSMLKQNHSVLSHYENVRSELDALSHELHDLTDHAVSLDANFDKFGYSAHLRTRDDSETSSLQSSHDSVRSLAKHEDRHMTAIKFFKAPVIRQYFHKGLIWRSPRSGETASFELFIDLVYVAVIDTIGEAAIEHASASSFLHYVILFCISWKTWGDVTMIVNWFEVEDTFSHLSVLLNIIFLYAFTTNIAYFFEETYTVGISFYIASRFFTAAWFALVCVVTPMIRYTLIWHAVIAIVGAVLWIGSIHVEYPRNLPLIFIAIFIDLFGSMAMMPIVRFFSTKQSWFARKLRPLVEYLPAVNIEHRVERTGAFICLVFGYEILRVIFQSRAQFPLNAFLGKGILGLIQAFTFNWIYFEVDAWNLHVHAIRRHWISTSIWSTAHLPFAGGFVLAASTLTQLVLAHDCEHAELEYLGESYEGLSSAEVGQPERWFYCGGLGVALLFMSVISLCHVHKRLPSPRLLKRPRLVIRCAIAIIIICLPLAHSLNSLQLIAITTALVVLVLCVDLFGNSCSGDKFWTGGWCKETKRKTIYSANCKLSKKRRRELEKAMKDGDQLGLNDVLKREDSVTSLNSEMTKLDVEHAGKGPENRNWLAGAF